MLELLFLIFGIKTASGGMNHAKKSLHNNYVKPYQDLFGALGELAESNARVAEKWSYRKCPFCAEQIKKEAIVCKHCGRPVPPMVKSK